MRNLTIDELTTVSGAGDDGCCGGGGGITIGDIGSGNSVGNGNSVSVSGNSASADGNFSGNSLESTVNNTTHAMSSVTTLVKDICFSVL